MLHQLGSSPVHPASSCAEILQEYPESSSGYYWVGSTTGHAHSVYCDMTRTCGGVTGGWMRVAYLDMSNSSHQCPSSLHSAQTQMFARVLSSCTKALAQQFGTSHMASITPECVERCMATSSTHLMVLHFQAGPLPPAMLMGLVLHTAGTTDSTFGHLPLGFRALVELYQHLLVVTISVIHDIMVPQTSTTPCGMERGVAATPAVPTTTLPGSTDSSPTLPLKTSR